MQIPLIFLFYKLLIIKKHLMKKLFYSLSKTYLTVYSFLKTTEKKNFSQNFKHQLKKENLEFLFIFLKNIFEHFSGKKKTQSSCGVYNGLYFLDVCVIFYKYQTLLISLENHIIFFKKITKIYFKLNSKKFIVGLVENKNSSFLTFFLIIKKKCSKQKLAQKFLKLAEVF